METVGKIYISSSLMEKMGLNQRQTVRVRLGARIINTHLVVNENEFKGYMVSPQLAKALGLIRRKPLQIRYDQANDMLHIGPIIGILVTHLPNNREYDPKSTQAELIFLSKIIRTFPAQIYIFTINSINWNNLTTRGYIYRNVYPERGVWESSTYPLPDVVYDRVSSRTSEAKDQNQNNKKKLMSLPYLKYFNPSFLNKWKVHKILITNYNLLGNLPETMQLSNSSLRDMLEKHKILYLKPENGSLGSGIIKVKRDEDDKLRYMIYKNGRHPGRADDADELMDRTSKAREDKPYIVQQGIDLANYKGSTFDIRIIYQKDRNGEWQIGKKFARVAARGSSIANLARGGQPEKSKKVMAAVLHKNKKMIEMRNEEIKELCKTVALTLEKSGGGIYGELGLDIGIDRDGKPWLIEVNSKPRKTTETEFSKGIISNTFKRPLEYAMYLAGFQKKT